MSFSVFNTLSRRLEPFVPLEPGKVRMYTCGPTVYGFAHIGNFRAYLFEDLLRRFLEYRGFQVKQVMNLTDVDDKTIRGSRAAGVPLAQYTRPFKEAFFEDVRALNIEPAEVYPPATEHIPEMIALIEALFKNGAAYRSDDGSVYFSIAKFPAYGKLAHLDMAGLRPGARVAQDDYQKDNLADFALWKAWSEADGDVGWDSPWGRGRPGWHIECSAMSMKYLGPGFDLHTGGVDNIFPHHEDEIAQSEAATGKQFVKYWMHCAHLVVDGRKMSKSLGNFFTLKDLLKKGYSGREVRFALLAGHYRQVLNFTSEALGAARASLGRLDEFQDRLAAAAGDCALRHGNFDTHGDHAQRVASRVYHANAVAPWLQGETVAALPTPRGRDRGVPVAGSDPLLSGVAQRDADRTCRVEASGEDWIDQARRDFEKAMDDDLNAPIALAALFELVREGNKRLDAKDLSAAEEGRILRTLEAMDRVFGFLRKDEIRPDADVVRMATERTAARKARNWAEADRLRDLLKSRGWIVQDTDGGFQLKRNSNVHNDARPPRPRL